VDRECLPKKKKKGKNSERDMKGQNSLWGDIFLLLQTPCSRAHISHPSVMSIDFIFFFLFSSLCSAKEEESFFLFILLFLFLGWIGY
jgi:hypothetical protein